MSEYNETSLATVNQSINGPVNAHLISEPSSIRINHTKLIKMTEQTLTLITHNPSFIHLF